MSVQQLSLLGIPAAPCPLDRLLLVLYPDRAAGAHIAQIAGQLCRQHALFGSRVDPALLHVTLFHLGDFEGLPKGIVDSTKAAGTTVAAAPFRVTFDRALSFDGAPDRRPFVLTGGHGLEALKAFRGALVETLKKRGLAHRSVSFNPHVTLIRTPRIVAEHRIDPVSWLVHEFVLVHSLQGRGQHVPLARWSLKP